MDATAQNIDAVCDRATVSLRQIQPGLAIRIHISEAMRVFIDDERAYPVRLVDSNAP